MSSYEVKKEIDEFQDPVDLRACSLKTWYLLHRVHKHRLQGLDRWREEILPPALVDPRQIAQFQQLGLAPVDDAERGLRVVDAVALADDGVLAGARVQPLLAREHLVAGPAW